MAAVLACGQDAVLSHESAAALWGIAPEAVGLIDVSVPFGSFNRPPGIRVHRRYGLRPADLTETRAIPVTTPIQTLLDLATRWDEARLERAVNEADRLDLVNPDQLRDALDSYDGERGVARLRTLLDRRTFRLTDSELERVFLPLVADAGLPIPLTRQRVNGFLVDFYWPELRLVVETDGLRYHRTPSQQARDLLRDQVHAAAGLTPLRFTHAQVCFEAKHVRETLAAVMHQQNHR
jgi:very-short-patch-repair endonuclease